MKTRAVVASQMKTAVGGPVAKVVVRKASVAWVGVAATDKEVVAVGLAETQAAAAAEVAQRLPATQLLTDPAADGGAVAQWANDIVASIEARQAPAVPLSTGGTPFQQRVWAAVRRIPAGRTSTYAEVARNIGSPTAARAVASACSANAHAIAIPCHRVVGGNRRLRGYRWGVENKRALLKLEGAAANDWAE